MNICFNIFNNFKIYPKMTRLSGVGLLTIIELVRVIHEKHFLEWKLIFEIFALKRFYITQRNESYKERHFSCFRGERKG